MSQTRRYVGVPPINIDDRPRPIADAATSLTRCLGIVGSIVLALVGWGVLTAVQGDALEGLFGVIPGVVNAIATVLTAFGVVRRAEPRVTPMSDPRDDELRALVALPPGSRLVPKNLTGNSGRPVDTSSAGVSVPWRDRTRRPTTTTTAAERRRDDDVDGDGRPDPFGTATVAGVYATPSVSDPAPAVRDCSAPAAGHSGGGDSGSYSGDSGSGCGDSGGGGM